MAFADFIAITEISWKNQEIRIVFQSEFVNFDFGDFYKIRLDYA